MKLPRLLSTRLATALALGCALLAATPLAHAEGTPVVALDDAVVAKFGKAFKALSEDAAAGPEVGQLVMMDEEIQTALKAGKSVNDTAGTKYPKVTAALKALGYTPDEFLAAFASVTNAAMGNAEGSSDAAVAKANVEYYKANKDKIEAAMPGPGH